MPHGGKLFIGTSSVDLDETYSRQQAYVKQGPYIMLSFSDTGCGMDQPTQAKVFEPFFTTKGPGKGTGLGLSTVYRIVKQNGGYIWVYSELGKGATFRIYFPRAEGIEQRQQEQVAALPPPSGTETVLLVEDEDPLRQLACTCLETGGYKALSVPDAKTALELIDDNPETIDLLLTDVIMPGMSGRELADIVGKLRPGIKVLFMSGYTNDLIAQYGVLDAGTLLLEKPFTCTHCSMRSTRPWEPLPGSARLRVPRFYVIVIKNYLDCRFPYSRGKFRARIRPTRSRVITQPTASMFPEI
jgi:CheY-like chemotaxis protein